MADRHQGHDHLLVAAHAAGDAEGADLGRAEALMSSCAECAELAADLRTIAVATAGLPAPRRPRDFFVQRADADRLRPNALRRLARAIGGGRSSLTRPLAGGLIMAGFAGLLVAALPGVTQRDAYVPIDQRLEFTASPTPQADILGQPGAAASANPYATDSQFGSIRGNSQAGGSAPPSAQAAQSAAPGGAEASKTAGEVGTAGPSVLVVSSVALIGIGALLLLASLLRPARRLS